MAGQSSQGGSVAHWLDGSTAERLNHSVVARLVERAGIKPLPLVARQVLEALRDPDYEVERLGQVFNKDPALATGVLRLANSPLYRGGIAVAEIATAVVRLGRDALQELLLTEISRGVFRDATGTASFYRDHCAACAGTCRGLAELLAEDLAKGAWTAGLLHDLGKLVLLQGGEQLYKSTLDATDMREPGTIHRQEREKLGFDHAELGGLLLEQWRVAVPLPEVVALHHRRLDQIDGAGLRRRVALLALADWLEPALAAPDESALELALDELPRRRPDLEPALQAARPFADLLGFSEKLRGMRQEAVKLLA